MRMKDPPHPGAFIKTEIIDPLGITVTEAARALRVSRPTLSSLLNGHADLSPEMALRLEKAFGISMDLLVLMQASFDTAKTRERAKDMKVPRYRPKRPAA